MCFIGPVLRPATQTHGMVPLALADTRSPHEAAQDYFLFYPLISMNLLQIP